MTVLNDAASTGTSVELLGSEPYEAENDYSVTVLGYACPEVMEPASFLTYLSGNENFDSFATPEPVTRFPQEKWRWDVRFHADAYQDFIEHVMLDTTYLLGFNDIGDDLAGRYVEGFNYVTEIEFVGATLDYIKLTEHGSVSYDLTPNRSYVPELESMSQGLEYASRDTYRRSKKKPNYTWTSSAL